MPRQTTLLLQCDARCASPGADIHDARRRRRLPMAVVAERAFTSRSTLQRVEAEDTNVQHRHLCRRPAGAWPARRPKPGRRHQQRQRRAGAGRRRSAQTHPSQAASRIVSRWLTLRCILITAAHARSEWRGAIASEARETILFEYDGAWLENPDRFSLEPALALTRGAFAPPAGLATFGSHRRLGAGYLGPSPYAARRTPPRRTRRARGSHPRGKRLPARRRRRDPVGALRFRWVGEETFQAPIRAASLA